MVEEERVTLTLHNKEADPPPVHHDHMGVLRREALQEAGSRSHRVEPTEPLQTLAHRFNAHGREFVCVGDGHGNEGWSNWSHVCALTLELTGTQRYGAARRTLTSPLRGAMLLRVRVERPVRPQPWEVLEHSHFHQYATNRTISAEQEIAVVNTARLRRDIGGVHIRQHAIMPAPATKAKSAAEIPATQLLSENTVDVSSSKYRPSSLNWTEAQKA